MKPRIVGALFLLVLMLAPAAVARRADLSDQKVAELLNADRSYAVLSQPVFDQLGWDLPDGGRSVKALADAAPGAPRPEPQADSLVTGRRLAHRRLRRAWQREPEARDDRDRQS